MSVSLPKPELPVIQYGGNLFLSRKKRHKYAHKKTKSGWDENNYIQNFTYLTIAGLTVSPYNEVDKTFPAHWQAAGAFSLYARRYMRVIM